MNSKCVYVPACLPAATFEKVKENATAQNAKEGIGKENSEEIDVVHGFNPVTALRCIQR